MRAYVYGKKELPLPTLLSLCIADDPATARFGPGKRYLYIVHYVLEGRGCFNGTPLQAGQAFLIYPGQMQEYYSDPLEPWSLIAAVSDDPEMERIFAYFRADQKTGVFNFHITPELLDTFNWIKVMKSKTVRHAEIFSRFINFLARSNARGEPQRPSAPSYLEQAISYIKVNYQNPITIGEIAASAGISQSYLYRIFYDTLGKSPKTFLGEYRLDMAKRMLAETRLPIAGIALSVGYPDPLAFTKFFTSRVGCPPREYRSHHQAE